MRIDELRPCDVCGGRIAPVCYRVRIDLGMFNANATNAALAMVSYFNNVQLGALFAPQQDVLQFAGDSEPSLVTSLLICQHCFLHTKLDLPTLQELQRHKEKKHAPTDSLADDKKV